ncbi:MAG TPA: shikimate dehydrogenase [Dehalococcoidia bacterium]|nr:shikimate dehydrogenase [Dehalococcoidia bacterium]
MTKRAGVIGHPLAHSLSPTIFKAAFDAAGIDATYDAWDTEPAVLAGRIEALRGDAFLGANVTIPHKEAVLPLLDATDDLAQQAGAVNTIVHANGRLVGHNTDVAGFARALREDAAFDAQGKRTMLLGSGGAARAVALALIEAGASLVYVVGRTPRRTDAMVVSLKRLTRTGTTVTWAYWGDGSYLRSLAEAQLIVNCTPVGVAGSDTAGQSPLPADLISPHVTVFDLVYNPQETPLAAAARSRGAKAVTGLPMLVYQAAASFRLWTGRDADTAAMFAAARAALA